MSNFFRELYLGRILGHPVHAMLVHFPSALFPIAVLFDIIAFISHKNFFVEMAIYLYGLGLLIGIIAACFGALDFINLASSHKGWKIASFHAVLNVLWLIIFGVIFGLKLINYPVFNIPSLLQLIISIVTVIGLIISNYLGGELVYHHHIGSTKTKNEE